MMSSYFSLLIEPFLLYYGPLPPQIIPKEITYTLYYLDTTQMTGEMHYEGKVLYQGACNEVSRVIRMR